MWRGCAGHHMSDPYSLRRNRGRGRNNNNKGRGRSNDNNYYSAYYEEHTSFEECVEEEEEETSHPTWEQISNTTTRQGGNNAKESFYTPGWVLKAYSSDHELIYRVPSEHISLTKGSEKYIRLHNQYGPNTRYQFQMCSEYQARTCKFKDRCSFIHCSVNVSSLVDLLGEVGGRDEVLLPLLDGSMEGGYSSKSLSTLEGSYGPGDLIKGSYEEQVHYRRTKLRKRKEFPTN
eukprot:PhF_6_TR39063/c1_g1_i1/m.58458